MINLCATKHSVLMSMYYLSLCDLSRYISVFNRKPSKPNLPSTNGQNIQNGVTASNSEDADSDDDNANVANYSAVIDSVIAMAAKDDSNSQDIEETKKVVDPDSAPKLPAALPAGMEEKVDQLKKVKLSVYKLKKKYTVEGFCFHLQEKLYIYINVLQAVGGQ